VLLALLVAGGWLRGRDLMMRPLTHDESTVYRNTLGFFERGFPSRQTTEDLPVQYVQTSELIYPGTALASLFFEDPRLIVRTPALCFGILTIWLLYFVGRRMFGASTGLIAAAIYAFSANCIQMAYYGRYLSQLQFFTLLTVYLFWQTVRGAGPLRARALWLTMVSFLAMFLTWEGSALIALGMVLAAVIHRRGRLYTILGNATVWQVLILTAAIVVLQLSHRSLQLTQMMTYGTGAAEATLTPMWNYPNCEYWYYVWASSWSRDALVPLALAVFGGALLAVRHAYRQPARFLFLVFMTTCLLTALLLSLKAWRYAYHLTPFMILLAAAALVAAARRLAKMTPSLNAPAAWRYYGHAVGALVVVAAVALGSGLTVQLTELPGFRLRAGGMEAVGPHALVFSDHAGGVKFVQERIQPGDVVMADRPHVVDLLMGRRPEYFPENKLYVQMTLDNRRPLPLHHYGASVALSSRASLEHAFTQHSRIWYISRPNAMRVENDPEAQAFLRQHMDVVYEDFALVVFFRGSNHRPADQRLRQEKALRTAKADFPN
jgi:hypothetical protein